MNTSVSATEISVSFFACGKEVCFPLRLKIFGVSKSAFFRVRDLFSQGCMRTINHADKKLQGRTLVAMTWMDSFFERIGDRLPDKPVILLPS